VINQESPADGWKFTLDEEWHTCFWGLVRDPNDD
jgi:hypothetical protein